MASVTLAESAKLSQDKLVSGVIENIVTVNKFYDVLPFMAIEGNALSYNRENALGDVQNLAVDGTITAKAAATFTNVTSSLTTIIGDAEVNGLIAATRSNFTDQAATQIASKAKSIGRTYQDQMINGAGTSDTVKGLLALVAGGQTIGETATDGDLLTLAILDELLDQVKDKDGEVDYLMMNSRELRAYYALLRASGGASIGEVVTLPSGVAVPAYRGVPIFRNDWLPINQTVGGSTDATTLVAGTLDDGSGTIGISGLTAMNSAGVQVVKVGEAEAKDNTIYRVKFYCGLANFSSNGLAVRTGITPSGA